jgi:hypothetical protein
MQKLTFAVSQDGLIVPVLVGLDGATSAALFGAGQTITPPVHGLGLFDTGSNYSSIASWIAQQLALVPIGKSSTQTASGEVDVNLYSVSIAIRAALGVAGSDLTLPTVVVHEFPVPLADADVLIGRNVLYEGNLYLEGPARRFSFEL